jgi:hypothetical protein
MITKEDLKQDTLIELRRSVAAKQRKPGRTAVKIVARAKTLDTTARERIIQLAIDVADKSDWLLP